MYIYRCQIFKTLSTFTFGNFCKIHHSYAQLWFNQRGNLDDPTYLLSWDRKFSLSFLSIPANLAHCCAFSPEILCAKRPSIMVLQCGQCCPNPWHCVGVRWGLPGSCQINHKFQVQHQVFSIVVFSSFWCSAGPSCWCSGWGAQKHLAHVGGIFLSWTDHLTVFPMGLHVLPGHMTFRVACVNPIPGLFSHCHPCIITRSPLATKSHQHFLKNSAESITKS